VLLALTVLNKASEVSEDAERKMSSSWRYFMEGWYCLVLQAELLGEVRSLARTCVCVEQIWAKFTNLPLLRADCLDSSVNSSAVRKKLH
jgi:hypothetical protein